MTLREFSPIRTGDQNLDRVQDQLAGALRDLKTSAQKRIEGSVPLAANDIPGGSIPAMTPATVTFYVSDSRGLLGVRAGMAVTVTPPGPYPAGLAASYRVPAADQLEIVFHNATAGPMVPPLGRYAFAAVDDA